MLKEEIKALQGRLTEIQSALKTYQAQGTGEDSREEASGSDREVR